MDILQIVALAPFAESGLANKDGIEKKLKYAILQTDETRMLNWLPILELQVQVSGDISAWKLNISVCRLF